MNPGIVFGFDNDDESVFERTVEFLVRKMRARILQRADAVAGHPVARALRGPPDGFSTATGRTMRQARHVLSYAHDVRAVAERI